MKQFFNNFSFYFTAHPCEAGDWELCRIPLWQRRTFFLGLKCSFTKFSRFCTNGNVKEHKNWKSFSQSKMGACLLITSFVVWHFQDTRVAEHFGDLGVTQHFNRSCTFLGVHKKSNLNTLEIDLSHIHTYSQQQQWLGETWKWKKGETVAEDGWCQQFFHLLLLC